MMKRFSRKSLAAAILTAGVGAASSVLYSAAPTLADAGDQPAGSAAATPSTDAAPTDAPATGDVAEWVSRKVAAVQPTVAERRFDQTGWLTSLVEARKLAKEHNRPVFLFTHDGRIALGRC